MASFPPSTVNKVSVEIYDVEGKRLRNMEGSAATGDFSFTWDHRDLHGQRVASGLYFARMRLGNESVVEKFVVLR
jgi:flagellar hook assembly protein FlgD